MRYDNCGGILDRVCNVARSRLAFKVQAALTLMVTQRRS
jgi:hypothetical protein